MQVSTTILKPKKDRVAENTKKEVDSANSKTPKKTSGVCDDNKKNSSSQKSKKLQAQGVSPSEERNRLYEQAILMLNYKKLSEISYNDENRYNNFAKIVPSGGPESLEDPSEIMNSIFNKPVNFDLLLNATSAQMSFLVPVIRIYKQYRNNNKFLNLEIPIQQQYELENFETMFRTREGRGGGAAFTNLTMTNIADSVAVKDNYDINLSFTFADLSEISKIRYVYEPTQEERNNGFTQTINVSYFDLIFPKDVKNSFNKYDLGDSLLKITIGWHIKKDLQFENFPFITQEFKEEIEKCKETFYLTKTKHDINFESDGVVKLKINYKTFMEKKYNNQVESNLLFDKEIDTYIGANAEQNKAIKNNLVEERKKLFEIKNDNNSSEKEKNRADTRLQEIDNELKKLSIPSLENKYRRFINSIYSKGKINYISVNQAYYENFQNVLNGFYNKKQTLFETKNEQEKFLEIEKNILNTSEINFLTDSAVNPLSKIPDSNSFTSIEDVQKQYKENLEKNKNSLLEQLKKQKQPSSANLGGTADKIKIIPYFYLGDLIEALLEDGVFGEGDFYKKDLKVLIGSMYFYDYGDLTSLSAVNIPQEVSNLKENKKSVRYTTKPKIINIADIPISVTLYQQWFVEEIINKGITIFTFDQFMESIFNNLIIVALKSNVYPWAPVQPTNIIRKKITITKKQNRWIKNSSFNINENPEQNAKKQNTIYTKEHFVGLSPEGTNNLLVNDDSDSSLEELENIYYISGINSSFRAEGIYEKDIKNGIRHIYFNNENGFVKSINFKRTDTPLLESSILTNPNSTEVAKLMSGVYNASIQMIGNSFFKMGNKIYINPTIGSSGIRQMNENTISGDPKSKITSTTDLALFMGIGGYYDVTRISTSISPGEYSTNIECRWTMRGTDGLQNYGIDLNEEFKLLSRQGL